MDTRDIIRMQREFFRSGKTLEPGFRLGYLKKLRKAILDATAEIAAALAADLGKSGTEAYMTETGMVLSELSSAIGNIRRWSRPRKVRTPLAQFPAKSRIIPEPYGNVLIMSPWNYPFLLCISPLISAVAAGNTAVIKPSAYAPATSAAVKRIVSQVFPGKYVSVIEGGRDVNSTLLDSKFDYIFLNTSTADRHASPLTTYW